MADAELRSKIGQQIRRLRLEKSLTQEDLAGETELHTNYISLAERGLTGVTVEALRKVLSALGIKLSEFMARIGE